jgi:hypothetical protein
VAGAEDPKHPGRIILAVSHNSLSDLQIRAFTSAGAPDETFGTAAASGTVLVGQFAPPRDIAFFPDGRILVVAPTQADGQLVMTRFAP